LVEEKVDDPDASASRQLRLTYIGHGTVGLVLDGVRLLTDPLLRRWAGPLRRYATAAPRGEWLHPHAVLLSHLHIDHVDRASLALLARDARALVPPAGVPLLRRLGFTDVLGVEAGDVVPVAGLRVRVVPARHDGRRYPFAAANDAVGFVATGSQTVYFAGDTGPFAQMDGLAGYLDLTLLPIAGWGLGVDEDEHLTPLSAARSLRLLRPRVAVPIHWGTFAPPGMLSLWRVDPAQPPRAFARYAAHLAPQVEVRILQPGETTGLDPSFALPST
jgi:L-ascorbate metabolism protein UlaG (beta-lactamase superfamily)